MLSFSNQNKNHLCRGLQWGSNQSSYEFCSQRKSLEGVLCPPMLSPRGILHLGFFVVIFFLWMSSLISGVSPLETLQTPRKSPKSPSPKSPVKSPGIHPSQQAPRSYKRITPSPSPLPLNKSSVSSPGRRHRPPSHDKGANVSSSIGNRLNKGKKTGLVLASVAGLLQVVVVIYLLVKRKQLLRVVEKYEV